MSKSFNALPWQLKVLIAFVMLVAIGLGIFAQQAHKATPTVPQIASGLILKAPRVLQPFTLTNTRQQVVDPKQLQGRWSLLFFGFTHCPMICPTTLAQLNSAYKLLQQQTTTLPTVMMVSIDPQRDNLARLRDYMYGFNANFVGVRGSDQQTKLLTKQLGIAYMRSHATLKQTYDIDHSGTIVVVNPAGEVQAFLSQPHKAQQIAKDFQTIVNFYQRQPQPTS